MLSKLILLVAMVGTIASISMVVMHKDRGNVHYLHHIGSEAASSKSKCTAAQLAIPWAPSDDFNSYEIDEPGGALAALVVVATAVNTLMSTSNDHTLGYVILLCLYGAVSMLWHTDVTPLHLWSRQFVEHIMILYFVVVELLMILSDTLYTYRNISLDGELPRRFLSQQSKVVASIGIVAIATTAFYSDRFDAADFDYSALGTLLITTVLLCYFRYGDSTSRTGHILERGVVTIVLFAQILAACFANIAGVRAGAHAACSGDLESYKKHDVLANYWYFQVSIIATMVLYIVLQSKTGERGQRHADTSGGGNLLGTPSDRFAALVIFCNALFVVVVTCPSRSEMDNSTPVPIYSSDVTSLGLMYTMAILAPCLLMLISYSDIIASWFVAYGEYSTNTDDKKVMLNRSYTYYIANGPPDGYTTTVF
jgi:hypothetical protein